MNCTHVTWHHLAQLSLASLFMVQSAAALWIILDYKLALVDVVLIAKAILDGWHVAMTNCHAWSHEIHQRTWRRLIMLLCSLDVNISVVKPTTPYEVLQKQIVLLLTTCKWLSSTELGRVRITQFWTDFSQDFFVGNSRPKLLLCTYQKINTK